MPPGVDPGPPKPALRSNNPVLVTDEKPARGAVPEGTPGQGVRPTVAPAIRPTTFTDIFRRLRR